MDKYIPKFRKGDLSTIILSNALDAENCVEYAKNHNMNVIMENTSSTCLAEVIVLFQKNGFSHKLFEEKNYAPDGLQLSNKILCLFEKYEAE